MTDEHADEVASHQGTLSSIDSDVSAMQVAFRKQHGMLQAHHLVQQEQSVTLRQLKAGQEALQLGQARLAGELKVGVQAIIGLLTQEIDGDGTAGSE
jgi:hypothetical protein